MIPVVYSFPRYLAAKKSIDDRALNRRLWQSFGERLAAHHGFEPVKILEVGAGIGTMVERVLEGGLLQKADYTVLDAQEENILCGQVRLRGWAVDHGYELTEKEQGLVLCKDGQCVSLHFETADVFQFIAGEGAQRTGQPQGWDVLVAHAFLDLLDLPMALPQLFSLLKAGGWFYFTINYDGLSVLEPVLSPELDALILQMYHRTMDCRLTDGKPSGDSRTGRHLFAALQEAGGQILAAGASDWVVFAQQGAYPADEAYFLHFILHFIETALEGSQALDPHQFSDWLDKRHTQVERGELVYIAHQLDFLGQYRNP